MSKKPQSKPKGKVPAASRKSSDVATIGSNRTLGVAAVGAVAAVAGALWFGVFGPLFRAPANEGDEDPTGSTGPAKDFQEGLTPSAGAAASPHGGAAPAPVVSPGGGHPVPDLAADASTPGTTRAPEAFRPDPTAPISPEEREALRPATGPAPSLVEDRGGMRSQTGAANSTDA